MVYVQRNIGRRFERYFQWHFPGFKAHINDGERVPDFYNPQFGFWVETKVGNIGWGVRLKRYQGESFQDIEAPVVYCMGLHNFDNARKRLKGKTTPEVVDILGREMKILEVYFVTRGVVEAVLDKESRMNGKETIEYCMMKGHIFRDILRNRSFRRHGVLMPSAEHFYGYDLSQLELFDLPKQDDHVPVRGIVLSRTTDQCVAEYLRQQGVIK